MKRPPRSRFRLTRMAAAVQVLIWQMRREAHFARFQEAAARKATDHVQH